jgi:hypothetical protein
MNSKPKASIWRIIQSDYVALIGTAWPLVFLALYLVVTYLGYMPGLGGRAPIQGGNANSLLTLAILGWLIGPPLVFWRVRVIQKVFEKGQEVQGQITAVSFFRDRGRVEFSFIFEGQTYKLGCAIMKTKQTSAFKPGLSLVLLINPQKPGKQALIRDLYI